MTNPDHLNLTNRKEAHMGLDGPSKTIIVEPAEQPLYIPEEAPAEPVKEPVKV